MLELALMLVWAVAAAFGACYVVSIAREVTYVTLADGRRQERSLPLSFKLFLPFTSNLERFVSRGALGEASEKAHAKLVSAGFEGLLSGKEFIALRFLVPAAQSIAWCVLLVVAARALESEIVSGLVPLLALLGVALFVVRPGAWLDHALKKRYDSIVRALPFALDVLTLSVEAGMDFINALQRNCLVRKMDALNEELLRAVKEIQVGLSRKDALRNMALRVGESNLKSVALALVQADELGVSLGSVLRIQASEMRSKRFDRAERLANEAPVKMLLPLMLCIFPAVFIILMGPVLVQAFSSLF